MIGDWWPVRPGASHNAVKDEESPWISRGFSRRRRRRALLRPVLVSFFVQFGESRSRLKGRSAIRNETGNLSPGPKQGLRRGGR